MRYGKWKLVYSFPWRKKRKLPSGSFKLLCDYLTSRGSRSNPSRVTEVLTSAFAEVFWGYYKLKLIMKRKFLFLLFLFASSILDAQKIEEIQIYPFDLNNVYPKHSLEILNQVLTERNFLFFSEAHGNPFTLRIAETLIFAMAAQHNLDWIAIEADYAYGYAVNKYLETGDMTVLERLDRHQKDRTSYKELDYRKHYQRLKSWRDSLNFDFRVVGLDVCKDGYELSIFYLTNELNSLQNSDEFISITSVGQKLLDGTISHRAAKKFITSIETEIKLIKDSFLETQRRSDLQVFMNTLRNAQQSIEIRSLRNVNRENIIAENFKKFIKPSDRVYCQFGYGHVLTERWPDHGSNGFSFVDWLEQSVEYSDRSAIVAFSATENASQSFDLFRDNLSSDMKREIQQSVFPVLIDFRGVSAINKQFQFAIILNSSQDYDAED